MTQSKKTKVFVSYSRHDEALVEPLAGLLGVMGDTVFLDVTSLKAGDLWQKKIMAAVKEAAVFVLCWCCAGGKSRFVANEVAQALAVPNKVLVPVLFCTAKFPSGLKNRQWIDLRGRIVHSCDPKTKHGNEAPVESARISKLVEIPRGLDFRLTGERIDQLATAAIAHKYFEGLYSK